MLAFSNKMKLHFCVYILVVNSEFSKQLTQIRVSNFATREFDRLYVV